MRVVAGDFRFATVIISTYRNSASGQNPEFLRMPVRRRAYEKLHISALVQIELLREVDWKRWRSADAFIRSQSIYASIPAPDELAAELGFKDGRRALVFARRAELATLNVEVELWHSSKSPRRQ